MRKASLVVIFLFLVGGVFAQSFNYSFQTDWSNVPEKHTLSSGNLKASAVGVLDKRIIEYKVEGKEIYLYTTVHKIYKINDSKGIEMFNKIYVPVYRGATITKLKARTILANGKVINIEDEKIKETEEDGRKYKIFAMEGVEKGAEIEYIYTSKRDPSYFGTEMFQNGSTPYESVQFILSVPRHLKFDAKGYNGFKMSPDSVIDEQRIMVGYDEKVPQLEDEKYVEREPYFKRVEYKLSYNISNSEDTRIYTWKEFGKRIYSIYTTTTSQEDKAINNLLSSFNMPNSEVDKIKVIEDYIKSNINIDKNLIGQNSGSLDNILKSKSADNEGIIKLFANLFEKAGISYQIVFVSRRDEAPIDEQLENWNRIDETVFYFPAVKGYLSPTSIEYRYPLIPSNWADTRGLFLKGTVIGTYKSAISSFGNVDMLPWQYHSHDMEVFVKFLNDMDSVWVQSSQIFTGYGAIGYRPIYTYLPKDKQDEATLEIIKSVVKSNNIRNIKIENAKLTDQSDNKPLRITADVTSGDLTEKAGNKVLFKVGELIGPQEQMYQEKPRVLPVHMPYPHSLRRKLIINIPEGYAIKNLNDLKINIQHKEGDSLTMGFVSSYEVKGNQLSIYIDESYRKSFYPLSEFNEFRNIINASADFNKIVLVLEKLK